MRRLPPLNQLKAFESAGRLGSFKAAASELCVSEAAISQHIRSLEGYLGAPLFIRTYSGVLLTDSGSKFTFSLTKALDSMAEATAKFKHSELEGALRVSVAPSLGSRWLLPRLELFKQAYPDIVVELIITPSIARLGADADLAIRHGSGTWKDAEATLLKNEILVPVASKTLLGKKRIRSPDKLLDYPLLSAINRKQEWQHWLISQGISISQEQKFVTFDNVGLALDAAIAGVGICLIDRDLVREDFKQKRLKMVLDQTVGGISSYYVVMARGGTPDPKVLAFKQWLISEATQENE